MKAPPSRTTARRTAGPHTGQIVPREEHGAVRSRIAVHRARF